MGQFCSKNLISLNFCANNLNKYQNLSPHGSRVGVRFVPMTYRYAYLGCFALSFLFSKILVYIMKASGQVIKLPIFLPFFKLILVSQCKI